MLLPPELVLTSTVALEGAGRARDRPWPGPRVSGPGSQARPTGVHEAVLLQEGIAAKSWCDTKIKSRDASNATVVWLVFVTVLFD